MHSVLDIPADIWQGYILCFLEVRWVLFFEQVSRRARTIIRNEEYWQKVGSKVLAHVPWVERDKTRVMLALKVMRTFECLKSSSAPSVAKLQARMATVVKTKSRDNPICKAHMARSGHILYWTKKDDVVRARPSVGRLSPMRSRPATPAVLKKKRQSYPSLLERMASSSTASTSDMSEREEETKAPVLRPLLAHFHKPSGVLAVACSDKSISLVDTNTVESTEVLAEKELRSKPGCGHTAQISCIAMDTTSVYTGSFDASVRVWGRSSGKPLAVLGGHSDAVLHLLVDPLGARDGLLVSSSHNGSTGLPTIMVHDVAARSVVATMVLPAGLTGVGKLAHVEGGYTRHCFAASMKNEVVVFDSRSAKAVLQVPMVTGVLSALRSEGDCIYTAGGESLPSIGALDLRTGRRLWTVEDAHDRVITSLEVSCATDGVVEARHLFSASRDGSLKVWDVSKETAGGGCTHVNTFYKDTKKGGIHTCAWDGYHLITYRNHYIEVLDFTHRSKYNRMVSYV
eukprot:TRINITY_DN8137_c0_g1_i1.p1 TRINITY_DN8137_c0_g1~~TRINITY_DN8137_c0_g1_i1.p1  ORF type:complete len:513 (+),score=158.99 TRINITY_DN8137_c0_g1_i1:1060-2598(+)